MLEMFKSALNLNFLHMTVRLQCEKCVGVFTKSWFAIDVCLFGER